jgi:nucleoside-diphosphate-sugar epimerase
MKIAIAGSSGFIGTRLVESFKADPKVGRIIGLSRSGGAPSSDESKIEYRKTDLADLAQTQLSLRGADLAIYLVHSMSPQARLSQGSFDDFDLQQADNFARACRSEGVTNIFYLGGLLPPDSSSETWE